MQKLLCFMVCGFLIIALIACKADTPDTTKGTFSSTLQTRNDGKPAPEQDSSAVMDTPPPSGDQDSTADTDSPVKQHNAVFDTENITGITFYRYYGTDEGVDVPAEHLLEISDWLASFSIGEEVPDLLPPGTNTIHVKITYSDGTSVESGLDTTTIDGITHYIKGDEKPACYREILFQ